MEKEWKSSTLQSKIIKILIILSIIIIGVVIVWWLRTNSSVNETDSLSDYYTIITDSQYRTMLNDGGSNYNVYYEVDLKNNIIKKFEDHYVGFKGYEYKQKLIYEKNIDNDLSSEMSNLLSSLLSNEDVNDTNNYEPYTIKFDNEEKNIYNENSINLLKNLLDKIDNIDNE